MHGADIEAGYSQRIGFKVLAASTAIYAVLTAIYLFPISTMGDKVMYDRWDGLLHTWIMSWNSHKFMTGVGGLFDANIFYPVSNTLAYSDHLLASTLIFFPAYLISDNPVLAHNVLLLVSFVLCGVSMMWLCGRLGLSSFPAFFAGFIYAFSPWRFAQLGHGAQLLPHFYTPLAIGALLLLIETRKTRWAALLGLSFTLQMLSSFYTGYILFIGLVVIGIYKIKTIIRFPREILVKLAAVGLISIACIYPFSVPYLQVQDDMGLVRTIDECRELSADPLDYFSPSRRIKFWKKVHMPHIMTNRFSRFPEEQRLFIGLSVFLLALFGMKQAAHRKLFGALLATSFILSLGPNLHLFWRDTGIPMPYQLLYYTIPGFKALRVPARFASLFMLPLSYFAAYGLGRVVDKLSARHKKRNFWKIALPLVVAVEYFTAPIPVFEVKVREEIPEVYNWLASNQPRTAIVELPQAVDFSIEDRGHDYMYYSTYHWHKLLNGRSGFMPPPTEFMLKKLEEFPSRDNISMLRDVGVELVVVHLDNYPASDRIPVKEGLSALPDILESVAVFGNDLVYRIKEHQIPVFRQGQIQLTSLRHPSIISPEGTRYVELVLKNVYDSIFITTSMEKMYLNVSDNSGETIKVDQKEFLFLEPGESKVINIPLPRYKGSETKDITQHITLAIPRLGITWEDDIRFSISPYADSKNPEGLSASFLFIEAPRQVKSGEEFTIKVNVVNDGKAVWYTHRENDDWTGVVRLGIREFVNLDGSPVPSRFVMPYFRGDIDTFTEPGEVKEISMSVMLPSKPGTYSFAIDMVSEHILWFLETSWRPMSWITVEVVP